MMMILEGGKERKMVRMLACFDAQQNLPSLPGTLTLFFPFSLIPTNAMATNQQSK
jgi:hypothetical protein